MAKIRKALISMIKGFPGGWDAIAAAMGTSRNTLENRVYETKRQTMPVDMALVLQKLTGTTLFVEAVAVLSGGTFVKLPADLSDGNELIAKKFRQIYVRLGRFAERFEEAIAGDDVIDAKERADLEAIMDGIHKSLSEMMALSARVYCKQDAQDGAA